MVQRTKGVLWGMKAASGGGPRGQERSKVGHGVRRSLWGTREGGLRSGLEGTGGVQRGKRKSWDAARDVGGVPKRQAGDTPTVPGG